MRHALWTALVLLLCTTCAAPAWASEVTIGWDPNPPEEQVTNYVIGWATEPGAAAPTEIAAGNVTEFTVADLPRIRGSYYFRVLAVNAAGLRSDWSVEVSKDFTQEYDAWRLTLPPTPAAGVGVQGSVF